MSKQDLIKRNIWSQVSHPYNSHKFIISGHSGFINDFEDFCLEASWKLEACCCLLRSIHYAITVPDWVSMRDGILKNTLASILRGHQWGRSELVIDSLIFNDSWNIWPIVVMMVLIQLLFELFKMVFRKHFACAIAAHLVKLARWSRCLRHGT